MPNIVYPKLTGHVRVGGPHSVFLHAAEPWAADDPFVADHPELFAAEPAAELRRSVPEQATAAPGEKRQVTRADAAVDETESLRADLTAAGVKVDNRWSLDTLRAKKAELDSAE